MNNNITPDDHARRVLLLSDQFAVPDPPCTIEHASWLGACIVFMVLVASNHEDGRGSLPCDHCTPREEHVPKTSLPASILFDSRFAVVLEVQVPSFDGLGIVNSTVLDTVYLEASALKLAYHKAERAGGIGTRENVAVHEHSPNEILILPSTTKTSDLQVENSVFFEQFVLHVSQELLELLNTNVLSHFQAGDSVILGAFGDITVVSDNELSAATLFLCAGLAPIDLFRGQCNSCTLDVIVL
mmetsp:Transcript_12909/g.15582  ORF Transcript_12909/g.15582 Transcript_12909/m.15582 type:complete len:242 (+) Transcript_12909:583-1308(+)